ncbi:hypothetical protein [Methylobacterium sp. BTF04]|uniref:hypothetical protein n=1 Tax=Methylobacterium sp. BTF04 TaxID=2708300 RepID=UPI001FEFC622|nr:hypothetical protein [Methylobacterium sp. BTF04]
MPVESWMTPEDTAALAAQATSLIDATLSRLPNSERDAFWASVRKCYNTPYNDPKPRALPGLQTAQSAVIKPAVITAPAVERSPIPMHQVAAPRVEVAMAAIPVLPAFGSESHAS